MRDTTTAFIDKTLEDIVRDATAARHVLARSSYRDEPMPEPEDDEEPYREPPIPEPDTEPEDEPVEDERDVLSHNYQTVTVDGDLCQIADKVILGGQRAAIFAGQNHTPFRFQVDNCDIRSVTIGRRFDANGDVINGEVGTWWGIRAHEVVGGEFNLCRWSNIFSGRMKGEGHPSYMNLTATQEQIDSGEAVLRFIDCTFDNCGGNFQFVDSDDGTKRSGEGSHSPQGGLIELINPVIRNLSQWPGRGSFMFNNMGTERNVRIQGGVSTMDAVYYTSMSGGAPDGKAYRSRGAINSHGPCDYVQLLGHSVDVANDRLSLPGGRTVEGSDRETIAISGAKEVIIDGGHFPRGKIFINSPYHMTKLKTTPAESLRLTNATGNADVFTMERKGGEWRKRRLGKISTDMVVTFG